MSRLGVPVVDAAAIVEGQAWASTVTDGRHYHPIVPLEVGDATAVSQSSSCCCCVCCGCWRRLDVF